MGKCVSIPEEQIEMKIIEETSDIISLSFVEDSICSLNTEEYLEIERNVNELLLEEQEQEELERNVNELLLEEQEQEELERWAVELLEENDNIRCGNILY